MPDNIDTIIGSVIIRQPGTGSIEFSIPAGLDPADIDYEHIFKARNRISTTFEDVDDLLDEHDDLVGLLYANMRGSLTNTKGRSMMVGDTIILVDADRNPIRGATCLVAGWEHLSDAELAEQLAG